MATVLCTAASTRRRKPTKLAFWLKALKADSTIIACVFHRPPAVEAAAGTYFSAALPRSSYGFSARAVVESSRRPTLCFSGSTQWQPEVSEQCDPFLKKGYSYHTCAKLFHIYVPWRGKKGTNSINFRINTFTPVSFIQSLCYSITWTRKGARGVLIVPGLLSLPKAVLHDMRQNWHKVVGNTTKLPGPMRKVSLKDKEREQYRMWVCVCVVVMGWKKKEDCNKTNVSCSIVGLVNMLPIKMTRNFC